MSISTVFLVLDHDLQGARPMLFETKVFWPGHALHKELERYATWEAAEAGHAVMP